MEPWIRGPKLGLKVLKKNTKAMPLTKEEKARNRLRKALQEGRQIEARTPENQQILDELRAQLQQEVSTGMKRIRDATYKAEACAEKRIKKVTEACIQQIEARAQAATEASTQEVKPVTTASVQEVQVAEASIEAVQVAAASIEDAQAAKESFMHTSSVQIEDVTDTSMEENKASNALGEYKTPGFFASMDPETLAKLVAENCEKEARLVEELAFKNQKERERKERFNEAKKKARVELLDRLGGKACDECEEHDWQYGGACPTHQEAIDCIAKRMCYSLP